MTTLKDVAEFVWEQAGVAWALATLFGLLFVREWWRRLRREGLKLEIKAEIPRRR